MSLTYERSSEPLHISVKYPLISQPAIHTHHPRYQAERFFFIDNLLVRIHFIIVMIRWSGLAPWEFEFPFPGSLTSTFLANPLAAFPAAASGYSLLPTSSLFLSSLELSDTKVYAP